MPLAPAGFLEGAVPLADQQIVGIDGCEVRHGFHIALRDEQVGQAVIVEIGKLSMPAGRGFQVVSLIGTVGGGTAVEGNIGVDRLILFRLLIELLQLGVAHGGERVFGIAIGVYICFGNPHAPDGQVSPAFGAGIKPRAPPRLHMPKLLLAATIIVPVIGDAQIRRAGAVPVGKEHG